MKFASSEARLSAAWDLANAAPNLDLDICPDTGP
jgi:hypothetical protein